MTSHLRLSIGQYTDKGRKPVNQDFHAIYTPSEPQLTTKGIAITLADGISSSNVSHIASETAVKSFLADYYCTSDAWSVKKSAQSVLFAANSWLHAQTRDSQFRYESDKGYVCTFSALVLKSRTAHIFHVGDSRIYRLRGNSLEQLTDDHRIWVSEEQSYLSRALGINRQFELDYKSVLVELGDIFILVTDGVYEHITGKEIVQWLDRQADNLETAATQIARNAYDNGSTDNLTVQIARVEELPSSSANEAINQIAELPFPPLLRARMNFDGYTILREVHSSSRSHVYLARDEDTETKVVIKIPSFDLRDDRDYLERFLLEEWIARRLDNAHLLKANPPIRKRNYIYIVFEYVEGQSLAQWMVDHPRPSLESVRAIVEQIAKGLQALHRMEILHQDLRPNNIMIDQAGIVKIIDFGSARVAGLIDSDYGLNALEILGTEQYTAPEYFLGELGTSGSDIFSLGVIAYHMLSGRLPYGAQVSRARTRAAQRKLKYQTIINDETDIPVWVDEAIKKAVHINPFHRYGELSEFIHDLRHPNPSFLRRSRPPLLERDPALFWKLVSFLLAMIIVVLVLNKHLA